MGGRCIAGRIALMLGSALCMQISTGCWERITFNPEMTGDEVTFRFTYPHAFGIYQATVWEKESRKTLWDINLAEYGRSILRYGEVPRDYKAANGAPESAKQDYPEGESALPIPRGKDIILRLIYSHFDFPDESISEVYYEFRVESDGAVVDLGAIQCPVPARMYDRFDTRIGR
jgi:hypothetical protein